MIFPVEYDFEAMLAAQGEKTVECVEAFVDWLKSQPLEDPVRIGGMAEMMDAMRYKMEENLWNPSRPPSIARTSTACHDKWTTS